MWGLSDGAGQEEDVGGGGRVSRAGEEIGGRG